MGAAAWTGEGRGTDHAPVSERGYAMLLAQLALVAGGVGTEAYDSVFNDQMRERYTTPGSDESCPINADCTGVPGGDDALDGASVRYAGLPPRQVLEDQHAMGGELAMERCASQACCVAA